MILTVSVAVLCHCRRSHTSTIESGLAAIADECGGILPTGALRSLEPAKIKYVEEPQIRTEECGATLPTGAMRSLEPVKIEHIQEPQSASEIPYKKRVLSSCSSSTCSSLQDAEVAPASSGENIAEGDTFNDGGNRRTSCIPDQPELHLEVFKSLLANRSRY